MANGIEDTKADVELDTAAHKHLVILLGKRHESGQWPVLDWAMSADGIIYLYLEQGNLLRNKSNSLVVFNESKQLKKKKGKLCLDRKSNKDSNTVDHK